MTNKKSIAEAVQAVLKNKGVTITVSDALTGKRCYATHAGLMLDYNETPAF